MHRDKWAQLTVPRAQRKELLITSPGGVYWGGSGGIYSNNNNVLFCSISDNIPLTTSDL
jgi:hypothetical protein